MNDNDPEFERSVYNATIPEDIGNGVFIEQVKAIDKDTASVQQSIKYKLAQEATGYFSIDEDTGKVSTGKKHFFNIIVCYCKKLQRFYHRNNGTLKVIYSPLINYPFS